MKEELLKQAELENMNEVKRIVEEGALIDQQDHLASVRDAVAVGDGIFTAKGQPVQRVHQFLPVRGEFRGVKGVDAFQGNCLLRVLLHYSPFPGIKPPENQFRG